MGLSPHVAIICFGSFEELVPAVRRVIFAALAKRLHR